MADRITKICQSTKLPLVSFMSASPKDNPRTVSMIVPTASRKLSDLTVESIGLCGAWSYCACVLEWD